MPLLIRETITKLLSNTLGWTVVLRVWLVEIRSMLGESFEAKPLVFSGAQGMRVSLLCVCVCMCAGT